MSATSSPGSAPKSLSSRLLTMKFMQRAAASPNTSPSVPEEPSPKRRKIHSESPPGPRIDVNALTSQRAVQIAVAEEEAKKQAALERAAAESGDTRWVLSFEDQKASAPMGLALWVVQTGYASFDSAEDDVEEGRPVMIGRRSFGKFNKKLEKNQNGEDESESSSEEDDENECKEDSDGDDPASELIRAARREAATRAKAERKAKRLAEKRVSEELAKKRKKGEINLNKLTALSGSGSCFTCGGRHLSRDCPQKSKRGYHGGDEGPPRKAIRTR